MIDKENYEKLTEDEREKRVWIKVREPIWFKENAYLDYQDNYHRLKKTAKAINKDNLKVYDNEDAYHYTTVEVNAKRKVYEMSLGNFYRIGWGLDIVDINDYPEYMI